MKITKNMTKNDFKQFRKRLEYFVTDDMIKHNFEQLLQRIEYLQNKINEKSN